MKKTMKTVISALLLLTILCLSCVEALAVVVEELNENSLDDHLILYTSFDASSTVDDSGNGHDGTQIGRAHV